MPLRHPPHPPADRAQSGAFPRQAISGRGSRADALRHGRTHARENRCRTAIPHPGRPPRSRSPTAPTLWLPSTRAPHWLPTDRPDRPEPLANSPYSTPCKTEGHSRTAMPLGSKQLHCLAGRPGTTRAGFRQIGVGRRLACSNESEHCILAGAFAVPVVHVDGDDLSRTDLVEEDLLGQLVLDLALDGAPQ